MEYLHLSKKLVYLKVDIIVELAKSSLCLQYFQEHFLLVSILPAKCSWSEGRLLFFILVYFFNLIFTLCPSKET